MGYFDVWPSILLSCLGRKTGCMGFVVWVVVSKIVCFHPYLGKIPILTNIFQRGWNHQLVMFHATHQLLRFLDVFSWFQTGLFIQLPGVRNFRGCRCGRFRKRKPTAPKMAETLRSDESHAYVLYIGFWMKHSKDPYKPTSIKGCHTGFEHWAHVGLWIAHSLFIAYRLPKKQIRVTRRLRWFSGKNHVMCLPGAAWYWDCARMCTVTVCNQ